jgi:hypothetical protein
MPILFFFRASGTAGFHGACVGKRMGTTGRSTAEMPESRTEHKENDRQHDQPVSYAEFSHDVGPILLIA